ncbi:MAG: metallophosphoesterase family protein [Spirochaetota bacterium]
MRIVALADTHLVPHGERYVDHDPWATLERAIRVIDELRPDLVVHAGDIVARPAAEPVYHAFFEYLHGGGHQAPWHLIPGNHDDIETLARLGKSLPPDTGVSIHVEPVLLGNDSGDAPIALIPEGADADDTKRLLAREDWRILVTHRHLTPTGVPWIDETIHPLRRTLLAALSVRAWRLAITGHSHRWALETTEDVPDSCRILTLDGLATTFDHRAPSWALADHTPSMALIDTERLHDPRALERIAVTHATPADR